VIKLFWWRLDDSQHGNFGDEITRLLIKRIFRKECEWSPASECELIGAGSILQEVYETKGDNKPYVWSSGLIRDGELHIPADAFKFCSVRGTLTLGRIDNTDKQLSLGDAGLLASYLLPAKTRLLNRKKYKIGILPHYKDVSSEFMRVMKHRKDVFIIDATWPCEKVIESIYQCETLLSSSLHGLIVADSVGTPNAHVPMTSLVEGGGYKFKDYYSVFAENNRYEALDPAEAYQLSNAELHRFVRQRYVEPQDLQGIKDSIIAAFPFK
jgi:pyruvyltransferase